MHDLEPYAGWYQFYDSTKDMLSPFYEKKYNFDLYSETIYGYYIDPAWDSIGSETLFVKILYVNYEWGGVIMEFIGEWNDAINNDIMSLKRNILESLMAEGVNKFLLIGEYVMNFHGSDDAYYEEWFEEVEEGWIVAMNFREHVLAEMDQFQIGQYVISGQDLQMSKWRTSPPQLLLQAVDGLARKRLG